MSEADALLAAIRQAPDDDAPRLIYADWLDEHGQPERAEFIRVQIELARNESPALRKREAELLELNYRAFAGDFAWPVFQFRFVRGLIKTYAHSGLFRRISPEQNLRGPGGETYTEYLRFYPDAIIERARALAGSTFASLAAMHFPATQRGARGTYSLNAFVTPPILGIEFPTGSTSGTENFRGELNEMELLLLNNVNSTRTPSREKYLFIPIPGFDSFSDSP